MLTSRSRAFLQPYSDPQPLTLHTLQAQKPVNGTLQTYIGHIGAVEDVQWSVLKKGVFGSVGEDRFVANTHTTPFLGWFLYTF